MNNQKYALPDLCDEFPDTVRVVTPMFTSFGGRAQFSGEIVTIKCHEDNSLVAAEVETDGTGKVLVVDGGGSLRCGLVGGNLALMADRNHWEGIVVYGCVRDVEIMKSIDLGVNALAANPMKSIKRNQGLRNIEVTFGGVTFVPQEYLYADENGVLVADRKLSL